MRHPSRTSVLSAVIDLRRLPALSSKGEHASDYRAAWSANGDAPEARILEIAELAYILEADGFPEPEIFRRVGGIFPPSPDLNRFSLTADLLRAHAVGHLSVHAPAYIKLGPQLLKSALAIAELWAVRRADQLRALQWPREDMLATTSSWACSANQATDNAAEALDVDDTDVVTVLDVLMKRAPFPKSPELRRMRARAAPGDQLRDYSTGAVSFRFNMGSAGIALVRNGRALDFMELMRN